MKIYDSRQAERLREGHRAKAEQIAQRPMPVHERPRSLRVYISTNSSDLGSQYTKAFETYVKPVWDAAALDYEVVEAWEWYEDTRNRISQAALRQFHQQKPWTLEKREKMLKEGGDGIVALGRPAYKALLTGLQDFMQDQPEFTSQRISSDIIDEVIADNLMDSTGENSQQLQNQQSLVKKSSWWSWLWWGSQSRGTTEATKPITGSGIDMKTLVIDQSPPPPVVGFIPFQPKGFWMRVWGWFNQRHSVQIMGDQALIIALGHSVPMNLLFPGEIIFRVEETELKESIGEAADKPASNSESGKQQDKEDSVSQQQPISDHHKLKQVGDQVRVGELTLSHLRIYYSKDDNNNDDDDDSGETL